MEDVAVENREDEEESAAEQCEGGVEWGEKHCLRQPGRAAEWTKNTAKELKTGFQSQTKDDHRVHYLLSLPTFMFPAEDAMLNEYSRTHHHHHRPQPPASLITSATSVTSNPPSTDSSESIFDFVGSVPYREILLVSKMVNALNL